MSNYKIYFIFFITFFTITSLDAQRWKRYRYDFQYGIGTSNFMGDLGGADKKSTFTTDLDPQTTKPAVFVALRYKIQERVSFKGNIIIGGIAGGDQYSTSSRTGRNINFKSTIVESSIQAEFHIVKEKTGRRYTFKSRKSVQLVGINTYIFAGIGATYFNPKGEDKDGISHELRKYHTEGQGLEGGPKQYSRVTAVFPVGFGFKYNITRKLSLGLEYGVRFTMTDYMDDTSDKYYDNEAIAAAYGPNAAYFADPREGTKMPGGTDERGSPASNDAYIFMLVHLSYKLRVTRSGLPKF